MGARTSRWNKERGQAVAATVAEEILDRIAGMVWVPDATDEGTDQMVVAFYDSLLEAITKQRYETIEDIAVRVLPSKKGS